MNMDRDLLIAWAVRVAEENAVTGMSVLSAWYSNFEKTKDVEQAKNLTELAIMDSNPLEMF